MSRKAGGRPWSLAEDQCPFPLPKRELKKSRLFNPGNGADCAPWVPLHPLRKPLDNIRDCEYAAVARFSEPIGRQCAYGEARCRTRFSASRPGFFKQWLIP